MPILLYRVDERLIHGQVLVGWGAKLQPSWIIVVDDRLAATPWEQELYTLGLPAEVEVSFVDVPTARAQLPAWRADTRRSLVLVRDVATMRRLAEGGLLAGERVNIGGIHFGAGRERVLPYVFLSAADRVELERLAEEGVQISAQDLPSTKPVGLEELLR